MLILHPAEGGSQRGENQANDNLLGSGFFEARGCWFFNNLEEVKATPWKYFVVWLGLDCMYRLLPLSSMAMGATQALK